MFDDDDFNSPAERVAHKVGGYIGTFFSTLILSYPLQALAVWAFWNWLAWNVLNAPQMNYWIALATVVAVSWFFGLFRKGS